MTWLSAWRLLRPLLPYIAGTLALLLAVIAIHHHGYRKGYAKADARYQALVLDVREKTAEAYTKAAQRVMTVRAAQSKIDKETIDALNDDRARLAARYDGLRKKYASGSRYTVPAASDPAQRFAVCTANPELWCIRPAAALNILYSADQTVQQLLHLQDWAKRQSGVTVDIPSDVH